MKPFINPFVDYAFKYIFGREESKELLIDFLNGLLCDEPGFAPIVELEYLDKEAKRPREDTKGIIYDIHCRTSNGKRFIVEMQNKLQKFFFDRVLYYSATAVTDQLKPGKYYDEHFMPVYCVCFMNFVLENDPKDFKIDVALCNMRTGKPISDKLRYIFIQTPLFDKKTEDECRTKFEKWMYNIINMAEMGTIAFTEGNEIFQKLADMASLASMTESQRIHYLTELKAYSDLQGQLDYARDEGMAVGEALGEEKGRKEGIKEGIVEMILNMAEQGLGVDIIAKVAKKSVAEVRKILGI